MRVLIVEDDQLLRDALRQALEESGSAVDTAADGEDGLWHAQSGVHDVIVLDLMLPRIDGLTVLSRIRQAGLNMPILILTARDTVPDRVRGLDLGADDYLVKPFALSELLARVRALVRREYNRKDPVMRFDDVEIDTAGRQVRRGGQVIPLSAREYAVLAFMAFRANQVVSRTEIWAHVYDDCSVPESNVVDVHIARLRRKIERPDRPALIHTHRGLGYLFGLAD